MDMGFWGTFASFIILAMFAFGLIFAATKMNARADHCFPAAA